MKKFNLQAIRIRRKWYGTYPICLAMPRMIWNCGFVYTVFLYEECQMSMDSFGITDEMWAKGERHLTKFLETREMPNGSLQKVMMTNNFLPMRPKSTAPMLLINGKYNPVCTKIKLSLF